MSTILDFTLRSWGKDAVNRARKNARGTQMAKDLKVLRVRDGQVTFRLEDYGMFQNTGVRGSVRTIAKVGKAQNDTIRLGLTDRKFKYRSQHPPTNAFAVLTTEKGAQFAIAKSIRETGFPTTRAYLNWLNKAFRQANKAFDNLIADELEIIFTNKIYGEE